jgi:hypothetical protein
VMALVSRADGPATNAQLIKVYLQGGQSNADGRASTNGLPSYLQLPQPDVAYYYYYYFSGPTNADGTFGLLTTLRPGGTAQGKGYFGPELTFGRTQADFYARTNGVPVTNVMVAIIKYAVGGTFLYSDWSPSGDSTTNKDGPEYRIFQMTVSAGLSHLAAAYPGATFELDGMIWVQGEADLSTSSTAAAYRTNLIRFIKDVRLTYGANQPYGTNLPFFLSLLSTNQARYSNPTSSFYAGFMTVRAAQAAVAATVSNAYMIDTDGAQYSVNSDYIHFDTGGQQALGSAFAKTLIGALPRPQIQSFAESGNGWLVTFTGPTGLKYSLERTTTIPGLWSTLTNVVMGTTGSTNIGDQNPPSPAAFYRVGHP